MPKPKPLFFDDFRHPRDVSWISFNYDQPWLIIRSYNNFKKMVEFYAKHNVWPEVISLDHDLVDEHYNPKTWLPGYKYENPTGADALRLLISNWIDPKTKILIHTQNPLRKEEMEKTWKEYQNKNKS